MERALEARRLGETPDEFAAVREGWCLGGAEFQRELLARVDSSPGNRSGPEKSESDDSKAENLVAEELQRLGWTASDLSTTAKGDPERVRIARLVRARTTKSKKWIAQRLRMGSVSMVSHCLRSHS